MQLQEKCLTIPELKDRCFILVGGSMGGRHCSCCGQNTPTLAVWGSEDRTVPTSNMELLKDMLPHAAFQVLPNVGHDPMLEQPETFRALLLQFLNSCLAPCHLVTAVQSTPTTMYWSLCIHVYCHWHVLHSVQSIMPCATVATSLFGGTCHSAGASSGV
mmetsp:Transcript_32653/g.76647  ORF Transcript_32653/g.76647 Transcript_32653/m.76647 type:complete len:159 (-) Transcript_32653:60-536(-)